MRRRHRGAASGSLRCADPVALVVAPLALITLIALIALAVTPTITWAHTPDGPVAAAGFPPSLEPWLLVLLAVSIALYAAGIARLWRHAGIGRGIGRWQAAAGAAGWITLLVALISPIDPLGERLFVAYMVQHELLMVVAALLLIAGRTLTA